MNINELVEKFLHKEEKVEFQKLLTKYKNSYFLFLIPFFVLFLLLFLLIKMEFSVITLIISIQVLLVSFIICFAIVQFKKIQLQQFFKNKILIDLMQQQFSNVTYQPLEFLTQNDYTQSAINSPFDRYNGSDLISIQNDQQFIQFCLLCTSVDQTDSEGHTRSIINFKGIFGKITSFDTINLQFKSIKDQKSIERIFHTNDKVHLDSSEFEKYYDVFANDQIKIRQLFTPSFMQSILDFNQNINNTLQFSMTDGVVYFKVMCDDYMDIIFNMKKLTVENIDKNFFIINEIIKFANLIIQKVKDIQ